MQKSATPKMQGRCRNKRIPVRTKHMLLTVPPECAMWREKTTQTPGSKAMAGSVGLPRARVKQQQNCQMSSKARRRRLKSHAAVVLR